MQLKVPATAGTQYEQFTSLGRLFLEKHQQGLKREVGIPRPYRTVVQQPLDIVHQYTGQAGAVCVVEVLAIYKLTYNNINNSFVCLTFTFRPIRNIKWS